MTPSMRHTMKQTPAILAIAAGSLLLWSPTHSRAEPPDRKGSEVEATEVDCENPCIDSSELEDGSVATEDLADGAVTRAKLAGAAVTADELADDAVTTEKIQDLTVGADDLADGSVTPAKLSFVPAPLARVVHVSGDGNPAANGLALLEAYAAIGSSGACSAPPPSAQAPCLVALGPGVFDVGSTTLWLRDHVDLEGSGRRITKILGNTDLAVLRLRGVGNVEIRDLAVEYNGLVPDNHGVAIQNELGGDNVRLTRVTARAIRSNPGGFAFGIFAFEAPMTLSDVVVLAEATDSLSIGIAVSSSEAFTIERTQVTSAQALALVGVSSVFASGSVFRGTGFAAVRVGDSATVTIRGSRLVGTLWTDDAGTAYVATSELDGVREVFGTKVCVHNYDEDFQPFEC